LRKKIKIQKWAFFTNFWQDKTYGSWDSGKKNENENEVTVFELEQFKGEKSAKIRKNRGGPKKIFGPLPHKNDCNFAPVHVCDFLITSSL